MKKESLGALKFQVLRMVPEGKQGMKNILGKKISLEMVLTLGLSITLPFFSESDFFMVNYYITASIYHLI